MGDHRGNRLILLAKALRANLFQQLLSRGDSRRGGGILVAVGNQGNLDLDRPESLKTNIFNLLRESDHPLRRQSLIGTPVRQRIDHF